MGKGREMIVAYAVDVFGTRLAKAEGQILKHCHMCRVCLSYLVSKTC